MHIPIIGNGDITTPQRAKECFEQYGVDAIMIGRASFGRPWIFKEVKHYLETGEELPPLSFKWRMDVLRQEVLDSVNLLDERRGILHVRRHLAASPLFKGIPNFKDTRIAMLRAETLNELNGILDHIEATFVRNNPYRFFLIHSFKDRGNKPALIHQRGQLIDEESGNKSYQRINQVVRLNIHRGTAQQHIEREQNVANFRFTRQAIIITIVEIPTCELGKAAVGRSPTSCEASTRL